MRNLRNEIRMFRNSLQTVLSQNPEEIRDKYREEEEQFRDRRLELRGKQFSCLRRRWYLQNRGYTCFIPKRHQKELKEKKDSQNKVLDSYF